jgi:hypothetical protein
MRFFFKRLVPFAAFSLAAAVGLVAQSSTGGPPYQAAAQSSAALPGYADGKVLFFDIGMTTGFDLAASKAIVGRSIGLNIVVTDSLAMGLASVTAGATAYDLFRIGYGFGPALGLDLYVGTDGNTAVGLGAYYRINKNKADSGLCSSLKLRLEYLFDTTAGVAKGDLVLALATSVGI